MHFKNTAARDKCINGNIPQAAHSRHKVKEEEQTQRNEHEFFILYPETQRQERVAATKAVRVHQLTGLQKILQKRWIESRQIVPCSKPAPVKNEKWPNIQPKCQRLANMQGSRVYLARIDQRLGGTLCHQIQQPWQGYIPRVQKIYLIQQLAAGSNNAGLIVGGNTAVPKDNRIQLLGIFTQI